MHPDPKSPQKADEQTDRPSTRNEIQTGKLQDPVLEIKYQVHEHSKG